MSDAHVTSAVPSSSLDIAVLACEPVTTFGLVAPAGLQGLSPTVSHALTTALSGASPPVRAMPMPDLVNRLTDQELAGEYATMLSDVARTGILERQRLGRISAALGSRYVLQPGLADFNQALLDKFELAGLKIVRTRLSTLRLWLQLWDAQTGHLLWESTGEVTVAVPVLTQESTVALDEIARTLWSRMIKNDLLGARGGSSPCP
jgi:hypothetical protein